MAYPLLKRSDRLPTVAVVQTLLNAAEPQGEDLVVDGLFGPLTQKRLVKFQRDHSSGLKADGKIGPQSWAALAVGRGLTILDAVDITRSGDEWDEPVAIRQAGGNPLTSGGMCNGVHDVVAQIRSWARPGSLTLLRFHGHGSPGSMGVSSGTRGYPSSEFDVRYYESVMRAVLPLRGLFAANGSVEMHGCRVAAGNGGQRLLRGMCNALGVPVTAGIRTQYGGGTSTFGFEGPTRTSCPSGKSLVAWSKGLPPVLATQGRRPGTLR